MSEHNVHDAGNPAILSDAQTLRRRAREHVEQGAVTPGYSADRGKIVSLLNDALATELVSVLRYKRHYYGAHGVRAQIAAAEFLEHANDEQMHADQIAMRIVQLGEIPDMNPATLQSRSQAEYDDFSDLAAMLKADLIAERVGIESYREMILYIGDRDPTTTRLLKEILAKEEEHADDLWQLADNSGN